MRFFLLKTREYLRFLDKTLLALCILAAIYGLVLIYSATFSYNTLEYIRTQAIALAIGIAAYLAVSALDPETLTRLWPMLLALNLAFLLTLRFWGVGESNRSWLRFLGIGIQPAELGKPVFILSFAGHLAYASKKGMRLRDIFALALHAGVCVVFVVLFSRDDGMSLAYACIALSMALAGGVGIVWFLALGCGFALILPVFWEKVMDPYQRSRVLAVFHPESYPADAYQAMHSRMAIKAGGLLGEGYLSGTQTQHSLIPTKHTDSIFPVAGEEFGLAGAFAVILLLALIAARIFVLLLRAKRRGDSLILVGVFSMLAFQTVLNLGMNLGIFPIIGLTLPFFSYGGSSLVTMFVCAGLAGAVYRQERLDAQKTDPYIRRFP
ncbi:MAG: FtsW/RodA/SpoVE family cell cycle protein [Oscillospiraceae bacterium]|nr:FtsW/RodA/SpoVE family cell cycle protein [Oscillospiraceae bacterium]